MDASRIAALLQPFLAADPSAAAESGHHASFLSAVSLSDSQLRAISIYIDILLRWNQKLNLTAVRNAESIVTRHFGESLFLAHHLFPVEASGSAPGSSGNQAQLDAAAGLGSGRDFGPAAKGAPLRVVDIGSGAGFPGIPLKLWNPELAVTLVESNHKKVAFLREVIRGVTLTNINVFGGRSEDYPASSADLVTLRAVERFDSALPAAARLLAPGGRVALLIGRSQLSTLASLAPGISWDAPIAVPQSDSRVLQLGLAILERP